MKKYWGYLFSLATAWVLEGVDTFIQPIAHLGWAQLILLCTALICWTIAKSSGAQDA